MGAHCLEDVHHFYKGGLSFASMNSEKMGMKQPSVYLTVETPLPQYLPYARFLLNAELTHKAKLLYTLLLDRATLSQKNNWVDTVGCVCALSDCQPCTRFTLQSFKHYARIYRIGELWTFGTSAQWIFKTKPYFA